jgi:hypothetical protein
MDEQGTAWPAAAAAATFASAAALMQDGCRRNVSEYCVDRNKNNDRVNSSSKLLSAVLVQSACCCCCRMTLMRMISHSQSDDYAAADWCHRVCNLTGQNSSGGSSDMHSAAACCQIPLQNAGTWQSLLQGKLLTWHGVYVCVAWSQCWSQCRSSSKTTRAAAAAAAAECNRLACGAAHAGPALRQASRSGSSSMKETVSRRTTQPLRM